jgi:hypothetical protein
LLHHASHPCPLVGTTSAGGSPPDVVYNGAMAPPRRSRLDQRVFRAAEEVLARNRYVTAIDVLVGLGWLPPARVDEWRQGRVPYLEAAANANLSKISTAMKTFRRWAEDNGLKPSETAYVARTRDRRPLQFSKGGDPGIERAYRTHWISPELSENKRQRLAERQSRPPDLVVMSPLSAWTCSACGATGDLLMMEDPGPVCLHCADMDHLVFLPAGDAALTRRAKKESLLSAVVMRFSRTRKRHERQGILVEEPALADAERQCLADEQVRARRRERERARRAELDVELQASMAEAVQRAFPGCPAERAERIARHTTLPGSGRIGRTAAGKTLDPEAITLAVVASVRHLDTPYDTLLMSGVGRPDARARDIDQVMGVLDAWRFAIVVLPSSAGG